MKNHNMMMFEYKKRHNDNTSAIMPMYKSLLGLSPSDLCHLLQKTSFIYNIHTAHFILLKIHKKANT